MNNKPQRNKQTGFTFIELIVAISIVAFTLPALFAIVFSIFSQQAKIVALQEVKKQGDNAISVMKSTLVNYADTIHSAEPPIDSNLVCDTGGSLYPPGSTGNLYFKDNLGNYFRFYLINNKISSQSSIPNTSSDLTSNKVKITQAGSTPFIKCERTSIFSLPIISINFKVKYNTLSTRNEDQAEMTYQTKVKLKEH